MTSEAGGDRVVMEVIKISNKHDYPGRMHLKKIHIPIF